MGNLMSRRQAVCALTFSLATGAFTLSGCGGGGSKRSSGGSTTGGTTTPGNTATPGLTLTREAFAGTVEMPPGLTVTGLKVANALTSVPLATDNTFQVNFLAGNGPMAAHVLDAQNQVVLMGFLRFGASTLSARSTAEVLTFYALGGWMLAPGARVAVVTQLAKADLKDVEAAIKAALAAGGSNWLNGDIGAVGNALAGAVERLRPPAATKSRARSASVHSTGQAATRGVTLNPTDAQSGIQIDSNDLDGFTAINNYRRRARLFVERVSTRTGGVNTASPQTFPVVELSPVTGVTSILFDLASALGGASYLEPTRSDFISAPNVQGVDATTYRLTSVGVGVSLGQYDRISAEQADSLRDLFYKTLVIDFVVPIIVNLLIPVGSKQIGSALGGNDEADAFRDLITALTSTAPTLWEKASRGDFAGAVSDAVDYLRTSYTLQNLLFHAVNKYLQSDTENLALRINNTIGQLFKLPNLLAGAVDTGLQALSIGQSTLADTWEFTVTKPTIRVSPKEVSLDPLGSIQDFEVTVGDDGDPSGNVFEYEWTNTAQYGTLRATRGDGVDNFTVGQDEVGITKNNVVYTTNNTGGSGETDTLTVTVYRKSVRDAGAGRQKLGTATVKVHIKKQFVLQVSPEQTEINAGSTLGLSAYFDPPLPLGTSVKYEWRATGKGTLSGATSDSNVSEATVTYHAPSSEGTETINVIANVTRLGTNFTFPTNSATVTVVVKKGLKQVTISGHWTVEEEFYKDGDNPRVSSVAYLVIPKVKDALSYAVSADGFNDTAYYGPSLSRTINPQALGDNQDRGGAIWSGLSGAFSPASGAGENRAWFASRFGGMRVKVVVTLKE